MVPLSWSIKGERVSGWIQGSQLMPLGHLPTTPISQFCLLLPFFKSGPPSVPWQQALSSPRKEAHTFTFHQPTLQKEKTNGPQWLHHNPRKGPD